MGWKMLEFQCRDCMEIFESLEDMREGDLPHHPIHEPCADESWGGRGDVVISAPMGKARIFEVQRGSVEPTPPGCISTKPKGW